LNTKNKTILQIYNITSTTEKVVRPWPDRPDRRLRPCVRLSSSVTLCIVAKRCVLEQKLQLTAYMKSYIRNRLVPKWMTLTFV